MSEVQATSLAARDPAQLPAHQRERRRRIVTAALELLETGEYERVQMRDVAERAGVALGTVYRYFTSKEHLYAATLVEWGANHMGLADVIAEDQDTDELRLRGALHRTVRVLERWPQVMRTEMQLEVSTDENARALLDRLSVRQHAVLRAAPRDLRPDVAEDVTRVCSSELYRSMRSWALGRYSMSEVEHHLDACIRLIFSPPPS